MDTALLVLVETLVKVSLVLAVAMLLSASLRRSGAALREHVLRIAFGAAVLVPLVVAFGPRVGWEVLPAGGEGAAEAPGAWVGLGPVQRAPS